MSDSLIAAAQKLVGLLDKKDLVVISAHKDLVELIDNLRSALPEQCRAMPGIEPALHRPGCEHEIDKDLVESVARKLYARRPHYYQIEVPGRAAPLLNPIPWDEVDATLLLSVCQDSRAAIEAYENFMAGAGSIK